MSKGVMISAITETSVTSRGIKSGMLIASINGVAIDNGSFKDVMKALSARPLTIVFRSTIENQVLEYMTQEFLKADVSETGSLNNEELAALIEALHRSEGYKRKKAIIQNEVNEAMTKYDHDGSGELEFSEFVEMLMTSPSFKLSLSVEQKAD